MTGQAPLVSVFFVGKSLNQRDIGDLCCLELNHFLKQIIFSGKYQYGICQHGGPVMNCSSIFINNIPFHSLLSFIHLETSP